MALDLYDNSARLTASAILGMIDSFDLKSDLSSTPIIFHGGLFNNDEYGIRVKQVLDKNLRYPTRAIFTKNFENRACLSGAIIASFLVH